MRMWMVNPRIMCDDHLLGEHNECHMLIGTLNKGKSVDDYLNNNLFEPLSLVSRHNALVNEFHRRNWGGHKTPLTEFDYSLEKLTNDEKFTTIDRKSSLKDLLTRCNTCFKNASKLKRKIDLLDAFFTLYTCPHCDSIISNLTCELAHSFNIECENCQKEIRVTPKIDYLIEKS